MSQSGTVRTEEYGYSYEKPNDGHSATSILCCIIAGCALVAFVLFTFCISCSDNKTTSSLPSSTPHQQQQQGGHDFGQDITVSSHAEASVNSSTQISVVVTKQTQSTHSSTTLVMKPPSVSSSSYAESASAHTSHRSVLACNAIRLHQVCCDAALSKKKLPGWVQSECRQLYHHHYR